MTTNSLTFAAITQRFCELSNDVATAGMKETFFAAGGADQAAPFYGASEQQH